MRKKQIILISGLILLILPFISLREEKIGPRLTLEYDKQERQILEDGDGMFFFPFQNTGDEPLVISRFTSSCGCLVPKGPKEPIMPGERDTLYGKYYTKRLGPINKTLKVECNDPNSPFVMHVAGFVHAKDDSVQQAMYGRSGPKIKFDKKVLERDFYKGDKAVFEFWFTNTGDSPLKLLNVKSSCGCFVPWWDREPVLPGERGLIKGKYDTNRIGPFQKSLRVITNIPDEMILLKVKGEVHDAEEGIPYRKSFND